MICIATRVIGFDRLLNMIVWSLARPSTLDKQMEQKGVSAAAESLRIQLLHRPRFNAESNSEGYSIAMIMCIVVFLTEAARVT
jgi:hypothetical protein